MDKWIRDFDKTSSCSHGTKFHDHVCHILGERHISLIGDLERAARSIDLPPCDFFYRPKQILT